MEFATQVIGAALVEHHAVLHTTAATALDEHPQALARVLGITGQHGGNLLSSTLGDGDDRILSDLGFHGFRLKVRVRTVKPWKRIIGMGRQASADGYFGSFCDETRTGPMGYCTWTQ